MKKLLILIGLMIFCTGCADWSNESTNTYNQQDEKLLERIEELERELEEARAE